jgi:hypothetical protein
MDMAKNGTAWRHQIYETTEKNISICSDESFYKDIFQKHSFPLQYGEGRTGGMFLYLKLK